MKSSAPYLVSDTARLLRREFDSRVRRLGMTSTQARLLLVLSQTEGQHQGYYAEHLEVEPITLCRLIDRMAESGLIERRPDPADRRAWRVHLTEKSHQVIGQVREGLAGLEDSMLHGLTSGQRQSLAEILETIRANFVAMRGNEVATHG